jgi:hypothetical protein
MSLGGSMDIGDLGGAKKLLTNPHYFQEATRELSRLGTVPTEDGWPAGDPVAWNALSMMILNVRI